MKKWIAYVESLLSDDNKEKFRILTSGEKTVISCLERIKSDYIAFAFGFISAVFLDEFLGVFRKKVMNDVTGFSLSVCNFVLLGIACFFFMRSSTAFNDLQTSFQAKRTSTAGYNAIFARYDETKESIDTILINLRIDLLIIVITFLLNLSYFIFINVS